MIEYYIYFICRKPEGTFQSRPVTLFANDRYDAEAVAWSAVKAHHPKAEKLECVIEEGVRGQNHAEE